MTGHGNIVICYKIDCLFYHELHKLCVSPRSRSRCSKHWQSPSPQHDRSQGKLGVSPPKHQSKESLTFFVSVATVVDFFHYTVQNTTGKNGEVLKLNHLDGFFQSVPCRQVAIFIFKMLAKGSGGKQVLMPRKYQNIKFCLFLVVHCPSRFNLLSSVSALAKIWRTLLEPLVSCIHYVVYNLTWAVNLCVS